mgnify:CR=1 FL=1|tara:strand:+ start:717 stop:1346 length:630 start_codon:yes stop_codon:yes gene_type:complete
MENKIKFIGLLSALLLFQDLKAAEKPGNRGLGQVKKTIITGEQFVFNPLKNFAIYKGEVVVIDPQMDLMCDKLTIHFAKKKKVAKGSTSAVITNNKGNGPSKTDASIKKDPQVAPMVGLGGNIDSIIAEGDVEIINKKDMTRAVGGHAVYTAKTEILVLTNNPKLFTKQGVLFGRIIEYNRRTGELSAKQAVLENRDKPKTPTKKSEVK